MTTQTYQLKNPIGILQEERWNKDPARNLYDLINGYIKYNETDTEIKKRPGLSSILTELGSAFGNVKDVCVMEDGSLYIACPNHLYFLNYEGIVEIKSIGESISVFSNIEKWKGGLAFFGSTISTGEGLLMLNITTKVATKSTGWFDSYGATYGTYLMSHSQRLILIKGNSIYGSSIGDAETTTAFSADDAFEIDLSITVPDCGAPLSCVSLGNIAIFFCINKIVIYSITTDFITVSNILIPDLKMIQITNSGIFSERSWIKVGNEVYYYSSKYNLKQLQILQSSSMVQYDDVELNPVNQNLWRSLSKYGNSGFSKVQMCYNKESSSIMVYNIYEGITPSLPGIPTAYQIDRCVLYSPISKQIIGRYSFSDSLKICNFITSDILLALNFGRTGSFAYGRNAYAQQVVLGYDGKIYCMDSFEVFVRNNILETAARTIDLSALKDGDLNAFWGRDYCFSIFRDNGSDFTMTISLQSMGSESKSVFKSLLDMEVVAYLTKTFFSDIIIPDGVSDTNSNILYSYSCDDYALNNESLTVTPITGTISIINGINIVNEQNLTERGRLIEFDFTHTDGKNITISEITVNTTVEGAE